MTPEREKRIRKVAESRQFDLAVVLENVTDPHNIFACMRSCDAVGVQNIYIVYSKICKTNIGRRASSSARKWLNEHYFNDLKTCLEVIREKHPVLLASSLQVGSQVLHDVKLDQNVALMFGNEKDGLSQEALDAADGHFHIPQYGMVKSLNISVACAITLYEALKQREASGLYAKPENFKTEKLELIKAWENK